MNAFDEKLWARARREGSPAPEGFDERVRSMLKEVQERGRWPHVLRRGALIGLAACAALVMTAVAVSPTLREALDGFLGGFAPYTQSVEGAVVANGIEIRVVSAMADRAVVKVYAEARDVSGQNRLTADLDVWGIIDRSETPDKAGNEGNSTTGGGKCVGFDEAAGTALLEFSTWGSYTDGPEGGKLEGMELIVLGIYPEGFSRGHAGEENWTLPLSIEVMPSREVALSGKIGTATLLELYLSPMGPTILFEQEAESITQYKPFAVYLSDGTVLFPEWEGGGGFGLMPDHWTIDGRQLDCWAFDEPVDPDAVVGISLAYWYLPIEGEATGEGYWLTELPG